MRRQPAKIREEADIPACRDSWMKNSMAMKKHAGAWKTEALSVWLTSRAMRVQMKAKKRSKQLFLQSESFATKSTDLLKTTR